MVHRVAFTLVLLFALAGCASRPAAVSRTPERGIVATHWQQGTIASWRIGREDTVWVCENSACRNPAPEALREAAARWGFRLAPTKEEAKYLLAVRAYLTMEVTTRDGERIIVPVPAWPLLTAKEPQSAVSAWFEPGRDSAEDAELLHRRGMAAWALYSPNIELYNTLWHHSGQLAQTIGGGSPGAYVAGFLLGPILNALGAAKAKSELRAGLSSVELWISEAQPTFKTLRPVYGFAAAERDAPADALVHAALDAAMAAVRTFADLGDKESVVQAPDAPQESGKLAEQKEENFR